MELYGQEPEAQLLGALLGGLDDRTMIDVGAEQGGFAAAMLDLGVERLDAVEPHPGNANALRARFAADPRVTIHECAASDGDGDGELHLSLEPSGAQLPFGHTLLERGDTDEIVWRETAPVALRSLGSLVEAGELPVRAGLLKIDTEGNDLAVVRGMGRLEADVVMVEHWTDLPHGLGQCPWTTDEMRAALGQRGFTHFAFIAHRGEFVTVKWDDGEIERGAMGNLIFLHDDVLARLAPRVLGCAGRLAERAVAVGQRYMRAADRRLDVIDELQKAADERLHALERVSAELEVQGEELRALRERVPGGRSG